MDEFDLSKSFDELLKPTDPPKAAALKNTTEASPTDSAVPTDPPGGAANRQNEPAVPHNQVTELEPKGLLAAEFLTEEHVKMGYEGGKADRLPAETNPPGGAALIEPLQTDLPQGAALKNAAEVPDVTSLKSTLPRLPPEGQAWFNGLNAYCRWAVGYDLRTEPVSFVEHWEYLRDALQKLEREFGPSDNWM